MDKQRIREIAENAFRTHFDEIELFAIEVEPRLDHDGDPVVDVKIYCANNYDKLRGEPLSQVQFEIVSKAWREVEDDLGFPIVQFYQKETFEKRSQISA